MLRRIVRRTRSYLLYFRCFKPVTLKSAVNLLLSSLMDVLLYAVSGWAYNPKTLFSGLYFIKPHNFYVYIRGGTDDLYYCLPKREGDVEDSIMQNLERSDVFVDVGANVGYYTLLASKLVGSEGVVISIEPVPNTFKMLQKNVLINGANNVIVIPKAAWNSHAELKICTPTKWYGLTSVFRKDANDEISVVDGVPLDDILGVYPKIKLIKIDVEGAEYQVLEGARKSLTNTACVILEISREKEKIIHLLKEKGFRISRLKFTTYMAACNRAFESK
ncbi:MAG: FkbM family methyltransferase [Candidatus Bathyarchaeia archaeon]